MLKIQYLIINPEKFQVAQDKALLYTAAFTNVEILLSPHTCRPLQYYTVFAVPRMNPITPPDTHHLTAAQGWLELENAGEAIKELKKISAEFEEHPDVLEVLWSVKATQLNWEECVRIAAKLTQHAPGQSSGWIHRSFALHELERTQEAYELLLPSLSLFKDIWTIPYNLACYQCQLGQKESALEFYAQALKIGGESVREMALGDVDLEPLRNEIKIS